MVIDLVALARINKLNVENNRTVKNTPLLPASQSSYL